MIDEKKFNYKKLLYIFLPIIIIAFAVLLACLSTPIMFVSASSSTTQPYELYKSYTSEYVANNIGRDQYYNSTRVNDARTNPLNNSVYNWLPGANVMNNNYNELVFTLELINPSFELNNGATLWADFEVFTCSSDGVSATKILSLDFEVGVTGRSSQVYSEDVSINRHSYVSEKIGLSNYEINMSEDDILSSTYETSQRIYKYRSENLSNIPGQFRLYGDTNPSIYFTLQTENLYTSYFVRYSYNLYTSPFVTNYSGSIETISSGTLDSNIVSVYDVLENMIARDDISILNEDLQQSATNIVNNGEVKEIQISYLERIGESPFATKKYAYVNVPVVNNTISPADVVDELGLETLAVGESPCQYFKYDKTTNIYNAYYLKNVWLSSKDSNGNSMNLFLDINTSYRDYYMPFVEDGIFTTGMYEWFWATMISDFPEIAGIDDNNLYGYFGYTAVPYTYTLNQLIYEMFDGNANMDGVVSYFSYREDLDYDDYMKLLDDYGYGWMSKAWNTVVGFLAGSQYPADHYFFYVDGKENNAFIGQNGADNVYDNSSAFINGIEDMGDALKKIFDAEWTKWIALVLGIIIIVWLFSFILRSFYKIRTAKQEYKNSRHRKRKRKW